MAKLLLNLYQVPDDEAAEVRALLDRHGIDHYETLPSRWGISHGAIWLAHDEAAADAARLLADYQRERQARAQADSAAARRAGTAATIWSVCRESPLRVLLAIAVSALVLALALLPFLSSGP